MARCVERKEIAIQTDEVFADIYPLSILIANPGSSTSVAHGASTGTGVSIASAQVVNVSVNVHHGEYVQIGDWNVIDIDQQENGKPTMNSNDLIDDLNGKPERLRAARRFEPEVLSKSTYSQTELSLFQRERSHSEGQQHEKSLWKTIEDGVKDVFTPERRRRCRRHTDSEVESNRASKPEQQLPPAKGFFHLVKDRCASSVDGFTKEVQKFMKPESPAENEFGIAAKDEKLHPL